MSDAKGRKIKLWDGIIEYEKTVPDARVEVVKAAIDAGLTAFEKHKKTLLANLRDVHEHGPKSEPFDADKAWWHLTGLARIYFWRGRVKQELMPAAERVARLRELAKALGKARAMANQAMQDDVGKDLFSAWYEGNVRHDIVPDVPDEPLTLVRIDHEFDRMVAGLANLETAAHRAADEMRTKAGRPKGTAVLQRDDIKGLAAVYRDSTGSIPGAGYGPFAKFAMKFLTALGRSNIKYESVIEAIKDARRWALKRRAAVKGGLSPFDEEFDDEE